MTDKEDKIHQLEKQIEEANMRANKEKRRAHEAKVTIQSTINLLKNKGRYFNLHVEYHIYRSTMRNLLIECWFLIAMMSCNTRL